MPTLLGNWVEERVLEDTTGVPRYKVRGTSSAAVEPTHGPRQQDPVIPLPSPKQPCRTNSKLRVIGCLCVHQILGRDA